MFHTTEPTVVRADVDWEGAVDDAVSSVVNFVPKLVGFLIILLIGWIIAKVIRSLVVKILERVKFDKAVERGGINQALSNTQYDATGLVAALVYYAILLITLQLALGVFGSNPVSDIVHSIVGFLPKLIVAVIIVVIVAMIARVVRELIQGAIGGLSYGDFLAKLASWFIIFLGVIAALNQIDIGEPVINQVLTALLVAIVGVIVVGVGGGLIKPMQGRWERWITSAEAETSTASKAPEAEGPGTTGTF